MGYYNQLTRNADADLDQIPGHVNATQATITDVSQGTGFTWNELSILNSVPTDQLSGNGSRGENVATYAQANNSADHATVWAFVAQTTNTSPTATIVTAEFDGGGETAYIEDLVAYGHTKAAINIGPAASMKEASVDTALQVNAKIADIFDLNQEDHVVYANSNGHTAMILIGGDLYVQGVHTAGHFL